MTPDEIRAWQQEHGGDAGVSPPDANGITVYRAADGSFINVRADGNLAMRGSGPPAAAGTAAAPAPAAPARPRGGGAMQQEDVEAWITQQGGQGRVQYSRATKQVPNPAADIDAAKAAGVPFQAGAPEKITVSEEKWTAVDAAGKDTGAVLHASRRPDGSFDIISQANPNPTAGTAAAQTPAQQNEAALNAQRAKNAAWPADQDPRYETDEDRAKRADARIKEQRAEAERNKPQVATGTLNTTSPQYAVVGPDGSVTWAANPNYQNPSPKPLTLPNTRTISWANPDGTITTEKNPNYVKPSKIIPNPSDPRKMVNVTEDDNGNPVILPVDDKTTIKPADLPVLQSKYGEIAQSLGRLAQELNQRVARQEMTPQERTEAFTAAYKQAETQVSELNSILDNSKAIWSGQVQQRGQSLSETQSRRSFASDAAGRAIAAGNQVAQGALPGHGKEIVAGVEALMNMQQRYAQGMGGLRESPEIGLPPALEQARGIGLPGYPLPSAPQPLGPASSAAGGGTPPAASVPAGPPNAIGLGSIGAVPAPGGAPPSGISNTTDAGGVPREYTPASVTGPGSGQPPVAAMGAALGSGQGYAGGPVAGGGAGMWDATQAMAGMIGDGSDPAWEEAVRRAAGSFGRYG